MDIAPIPFDARNEFAVNRLMGDIEHQLERFLQVGHVVAQTL